MLTTLILTLLLQVTAVLIDQQATAHWDTVSQDVEGNPEVIASYQLAVVPQGETPTADTPLLQIPGTETQVTLGLHMLARALPKGTYDVRVRAVDDAGNVSDWSNVLTVGWPDLLVPKAPLNLRLTE